MLSLFVLHDRKVREKEHAAIAAGGIENAEQKSPTASCVRSVLFQNLREPRLPPRQLHCSRAI